MSDRRWGVWVGAGFVATIVGLSTGSTRPERLEELPTPESTLADVGKRLSQSLSADELTTLATRGDRVLSALTREERLALGRAALRFRVDRPTVVYVASPPSSVPFWLADQGFVGTGWTLKVGESRAEWVVSRKTFEPGPVGLGINGLDRSPKAQYAVFLKTVDGKPISPAGLENERNWSVLPASEGTSLARGISLPIVALPEELAGSTLLQPNHDQRHATMLARGRVWKTHVVSGRKPDQITIAFGLDASRELVWSWRTAPGASRSVVRLRAGSGLERVLSGRSERVETADVLNDPVMIRHVVKVSGLEPGTIYSYSVGDGTEEGTSAFSSVRTAPAPGGDFSLMSLGDPQCGLEGWGKLLAGAFSRHRDIGAVLIAGDLVDRGNERTNWDHFFLRAAGVFEKVPVMPCAGNHEYLDRGPRLYRAFFELPENGPSAVDRDLVYSFEYADAFVAILDSTRAVFDPAEAARQAEWLDRALSKTSRTWKLVMFHHPIYASHTWREYPALGKTWVPVFDKHHVDLVLQGHDHAYMRTYPMIANHRATTPKEGTIYTVAVSGDKYCEQNPRDYGDVAFTNISTYQILDFRSRENSMIYRAFDANGREVDRFVIRKSSE